MLANWAFLESLTPSIGGQFEHDPRHPTLSEHNPELMEVLRGRKSYLFIIQIDTVHADHVPARRNEREDGQAFIVTTYVIVATYVTIFGVDRGKRFLNMLHAVFGHHT